MRLLQQKLIILEKKMEVGEENCSSQSSQASKLARKSVEKFRD